LKIAILGLNFTLGKRSLEDERLKELANLLKPQKTTPIQIEILDSTRLNDADAIILKEELKEDIIIMDLEKIESLILKEPTFKALLEKLNGFLEKEKFLNEISFSLEEENNIQAFNLLTFKPISLMKEENQEVFNQKIKELYYKSKRLCFFTANQRELRAWEIKEGTTAYTASGLIHSDIQKGFIKAEVINYTTLKEIKDLNQAKGKGMVRLEGKDYIIQDGDLIYFRFNV